MLEVAENRVLKVLSGLSLVFRLDNKHVFDLVANYVGEHLEFLQESRPAGAGQRSGYSKIGSTVSKVARSLAFSFQSSSVSCLQERKRFSPRSHFTLCVWQMK